MRLVALAIWLNLHAGAGSAAVSAGPAPDGDPHRVVRGMTVSCQTWGWEWGSDAMPATLDELAALGVNWVAIHPYARVQRDGSVVWRDGLEGAEWLARPIAEAHRRGLKILIKPHLAYWGAGFTWAGDIAFDSPAAWGRFFSGYRGWMRALASATRDADAICVGSELDRTVEHELEWRAIIADVRRIVGSKPVTYAANWDTYERVGFWDALDAICVHAYFPLSEAGEIPDDDTLRRGARKWVGRLEAYGRAHHRPVVLGELGYDITPTAAVRPWESGRRHGPRRAAQPKPAEDERLQERCLSAALAAIAGSDVVRGAFLWKWFPGGPEDSRGENFLMSTPAMRAVIARYWRASSGGAGGGR